MATGFVERVKMFITSPGKAFEKEHKTTLKESMKYGFIGLLILAILLSITTSITGLFSSAGLGELGFLSIPLIFILVLFAGFVGLLITALWYHLWAYIFGARQGYKTTIKALFFSNTPTYILGWIPIVNFITGIWSLIIFGIGLKKLQKLSTGRAVAAIVIAVIIPLIIFAAIILWAIATFGPEILTNNTTTSASLIPY